jgi:hypothetical protein
MYQMHKAIMSRLANPKAISRVAAACCSINGESTFWTRTR